QVKSKSLNTYLHEFAVAANQSYDSRGAKIIFKSRSTSLSDTLTINQAQRDAVIFADKKSFFIQRAGGSVNYQVKSNIGYSVTISGGEGWIEEVSTKGLVSKEHSFVISANPTSGERSGSVIFSTADNLFRDTINIKQWGFDGFFVFLREGETLSSYIPESERSSVVRFRVVGPLMASDFPFLRDSLVNMESLSLEGATIQNNEIPANAFRVSPPVAGKSGQPAGIPGQMPAVKSGQSGQLAGKPGWQPVGKFTSLAPGGDKLRSIYLPPNLVKIGEYAFFGRTSLDTIHLPSLITAIGSYSFAQCSALTMVISDIAVPFAIFNVFSGINPDAHLT
ncbi:MAG: BACON domain-containing carbohydrate-binding protein, partial [Bacteroidales bacterium]|nr:BACON domain-containing carbohydrate-binding protein [Bacteroidales bacterium]